LTDFVIYTRNKPFCPFCRDLKELLESKGIDFVEYDLDDEGIREFFSERGHRTVPQVYYKGVSLGGLNATFEFLNNGKL